MDVLAFRNDIKDLKRLKEIVTILVEEGYHSHLAKANLAKHAKISSRVRHSRKQAQATPVRVREAMERLGPTFVKIAQVLSLRPDLVPNEYCEEFRKLQDHASPISFTQVKEVIERELGKPLKKCFKDFSRKPIASASVAQVHRATLHDGTLVVVKVQRPGIREKMEQDIDIMMYLAKKLDRSKLGKLHLARVVEEFRTYTERELSFLAEQSNTQKIHDFFKDDPCVIIPKPHSEVSTDKVFVMEYIDGIQFSELDEIKKAGFDTKELDHICAQALLKQVFEHNVFHADPHPGNILAVKEGKKTKIGILDFGIVGYLDEKSKRGFFSVLRGLLANDVHEITKALLKLGEMGPNFKQDIFEQKLSVLLADWNPNDLESSKITTLVYNMALLAIDNDIRMPPYFTTTAKAMVTMEGTAIWLDPHMNLTEEVKPYLESYAQKEYGPEYLVKEAKRTIPQAKSILEELPDAAEAMMESLRKGSLSIRIDQKDINSFTREYDLEMNRRNVVLLAGSLFLGSAVFAAISPSAEIISLPIYAWGLIGFLLSVLAFIHLSMKINKKLNEEEL